MALSQVLSPFIYHATQKLLAESFKDASKPLPTRMRERRGLYQARACRQRRCSLLTPSILLSGNLLSSATSDIACAPDSCSWYGTAFRLCPATLSPQRPLRQHGRRAQSAGRTQQMWP